ncbi:MAG: protein phosphatase 2C domain-containing protein [Candidatus Pacebacteria bacterium]|nr:protein phosphatase 2C domain-containing protein [Candidatus Paceibacterota bacterium]
MAQAFKIAGGSTVGSDHLNVPKNSHDAFNWKVFPGGVIIGVVCDGLGDPHVTIASEFGARLGSLIIPEVLYQAAMSVGLAQANHADVLHPDNPMWEKAKQNIISQYRNIILTMTMSGGSFSEIALGYFMHTTVGVIITPQITVFFHIGDGVVIVNDDVNVLGPFPNNQPPCVAQALLSEKPIPFQIPIIMPTAELDHFLIGTDGVGNLLEDGLVMPNGKPLGSIDQFWSDKALKNADFIRRRLVLANQRIAKIDRESVQQAIKAGNANLARIVKGKSLLNDDTTILVGVRTRGE